MPGHLARPRGHRWSQQEWHSWPGERVRERDDAAYAERLKELLERAVANRTSGAHHIGVSLSGGLDSTSIAASLRAVRPDARIVALSVPFLEPRADERHLQESVARHIGAELRWAPLEDDDPFCGDPVRMLQRLGAPPVAPNHFFVERVAAAGSAAGIQVALDGIDGDGAVGGNWTYLSDLFMRGRWRSLARERRALSNVHGIPPIAVCKSYIAQPLVPAAMRRGLAKLRNKQIAPPFIAPRLHRRATRALMQAPWAPAMSFAARERMLVHPGAAPAVIEAIDEAWLAHGIVPAHPFTDRDLVAFCLGLPRDQKVRMGVTKIVLRNAMRGSLPPEVTERTAKAEMGSAFFAGLSRSAGGSLSKGLSLATSNLEPWIPAGEIARMSEQPVGGLASFRTAFLSIWRAWVDDTLGASRWEPVTVLKEAE